MIELPKMMTGKAATTPFGVEWNKLIRYLRSIRPVKSAGSLTVSSPFGTATNPVQKSDAFGTLVYIPVCRSDGTRVYAGVRVHGIFTSNTETVEDPTLDDETVPANSVVLE